MWRTEEELEYEEASDKHRQALLEGLELSEESQTVNNAAVKPECEVQELGDAELQESGQVVRAMCRDGDVHEGGEKPDTRKLDKVEEGMQLLERSGEGDVGDAGVETRRYDRGCARGFGLGTRTRKEVDVRRHGDGQRHSGETRVGNAGLT